MLPVVAIVGKPNVGKSTLFNQLTQTRDALVAELPGLTRDRIYGKCLLGTKPFIIIDTGGIEGAENLLNSADETKINDLMLTQVYKAIAEADIILLLMDGKTGLTAADYNIVQRLRAVNKPIFLVINKTEAGNTDVILSEFYSLGLNEPLAIAAAHRKGLHTLVTRLEQSFVQCVDEWSEAELPLASSIKIAVIGRPNVGKSTLVNRMLGEERVVTFDSPGTTRDSIFISFTRREQAFTLIDTAGVRRRSRVEEVIEKFSILKSLKAIEESHVVILVIDAQQGIVDQDLHLLGFILEAGRALVIAVNKWDGLSIEQKASIKSELNRRLVFINFAIPYFISALHGTGVGNLFTAITQAYAAATQKLSTPQLTRILQGLVAAHEPPLVHGRRIKLRYAHAGGHNPPLIIIHGNQLQELPLHYQRYLSKGYQEALHLVGTPLRVEFKTSENPFKGRKNKLTPRQLTKRKRLMRHVKKK